MITGVQIDERIEILSKNEAFLHLQTACDGEFISYLAEEAEWMSEEERDLLLYTASVVLSFFPNTKSAEVLSTLIDLEEKNLQLLYSSKNHSFFDRITIFFHNFQEEDLLAFIEDVCHIEENDGLTPAGQELIFIKLKSLLDFLLQFSES